MKKIFLILLIACSFAMFGQGPVQTFNGPVKMAYVQDGPSEEYVLVRGADMIVKKVLKSSISGTTPTLQAVTNTGDTSTNRVYLNGGISTTQPNAASNVNAVTPLIVTGGAGGNTTATSGTATGGNAGEIKLQGGNGGNALTSSGTNLGGNAGPVYLLGGDGGLATGGSLNIGGRGGDATLQGGDSWGGNPGFASVKAGNNKVTGGAGGNVYIVSGWGNNADAEDEFNGTIFLGLSPNGSSLRGNTVIGNTTDDYNHKLQVNGNAIIKKVLGGEESRFELESGGTKIIAEHTTNETEASINTYTDDGTGIDLKVVDQLNSQELNVNLRPDVFSSYLVNGDYQSRFTQYNNAFTLTFTDLDGNNSFGFIDPSPKTGLSIDLGLPPTSGTLAIDEALVHLSGNENIFGTKSFFSKPVFDIGFILKDTDDNDVTIQAIGTENITVTDENTNTTLLAATNGQIWSETSSGYAGVLNFTGITANHDYAFPDASGTIATVEATTLQAVTSVAGGTSTNQHLYFNAGFSASEMDVDGGATATVSPTTASFEVSKTDGNYGQVTTLGESVTMKSGNSADAIGMVETSAASVRLGTYTDTSDSELFVYGNQLNYTVNDGSGEGILNFDYAQGLGIVTSAGGEFLNIKSDYVTATRTLQAPNESGTIATVKYKVYTALLTQSSTGAPTATVLENTLGGTVTYSYVEAGGYTATLTGGFTANKTVLFIASGYDGSDSLTPFKTGAYRLDANDIRISVLDPTATNVNGGLNDTSFEIRVYP